MATNEPYAARALSNAKRAVIKVGTAILIGEDGEANASWLESLAADMVDLTRTGTEVVLVSSGAVALGRARLGLGGDLRLDEKQAASAAGQARLVDAWASAFAPHAITVAQVLLTLDDTENRRRYLNARATINMLIELRALPLVNENDTVATSEIRYGDNDRLAAHTAQLVGADVLVILSDIDGLYTADPRCDPHAQRIPVVDKITPDIVGAAGPERQGGVGSGGMVTKVAAAQIAGASGCATIIGPGAVQHPLNAITSGEPATLFRASDTIENARQRWIAGRIKPAGVIIIDEGAVRAIRKGASLLPAGIVALEGAFRRGDAVSVMALEGELLGQGLSAYDSSELERIKGLSSDTIKAVLGYSRRPAAIERNDLVLRKPHEC